MVRSILFLLTVLGLGLHFNSCKSPETSQDKSAVGNPVMTSYLEIKDALYNDDAEAAKTVAKRMLIVLESYVPSDSTGWNAASQKMHASAWYIVGAKDITEQRFHFEKLSDALYENAEKYGLVDGTLYRQYCPMAFDFKGAYWINEKKKIENPYFGDEMPQCGEVKSVLESE